MFFSFTIFCLSRWAWGCHTAVIRPIGIDTHNWPSLHCCRNPLLICACDCHSYYFLKLVSMGLEYTHNVPVHLKIVHAAFILEFFHKYEEGFNQGLLGQSVYYTHMHIRCRYPDVHVLSENNVCLGTPTMGFTFTCRQRSHGSYTMYNSSWFICTA